jgi:hypothetical protein
MKSTKMKSTKMKSTKTSNNNYCSSRKFDTFVLLSILSLVVIIILSNTGNIDSSKFKNAKFKKIGMDANNTIEPFTQPKPFNTPRNFELYRVDTEQNKLSFIFSSPLPHIIGEQAEEYILVLNSYTTPTNPLDEKNKKKLVDTQLIIKKKEDLKSREINLLKKGMYMFTIEMPPKEMEYYNEETGKIQDETLTYRPGLIAKYNNIHSKVIPCSNIPYGEIDLNNNDSFDYLDNKIRAELGIDTSTKKTIKINEDIEDERDIYDNTSNDSKYQQLKEQLGGYPTNLILNEQTGVDSLEHLINQDPDKYTINFNVGLKDE